MSNMFSLSDEIDIDVSLVVVKNKVWLKKCLKKFQIWQIDLSITSLRLIP
jgi:hypothetical protein